MSFQAREISKDQPKAYESLALLEDILGIRLSFARNEEDRAKWEAERAGVRQGLVLTKARSLRWVPVPPVTAVPENSNQQHTQIVAPAVQPAVQPAPPVSPTITDDAEIGRPNTASDWLAQFERDAASRACLPANREKRIG